MVWPALAAAGGMVLGTVGEQRGADATRKQLAKEARKEEQLGRDRRASTRQALGTVNPESMLERASSAASATYRPQQDMSAAVAAAYGLDSPEVLNAIAEINPTMRDAAFAGDGMGVAEDGNRAAMRADTDRQKRIDRDQWWWERFMPNRVARAGDRGKAERMLGQVLMAYGLGGMKGQMAQKRPSGDPQQPAKERLGRSMTGDLQDADWLGMGGR